MVEISIKGGRYGAEFEIGKHWYSLLTKVKWYEFILPFNMFYLGHYLGPQKEAFKKSKQNQFTLIAIGWGLGGILSAILVRHSLDMEGIKQGIFNTGLFIFGSIGVAIWFSIRKKKWLEHMSDKEFPRIYLIPSIKTISLNIFMTIFMLSIAIFMIFTGFTTNRISDWRFLIVMPMFGAFFMHSGIFANIPLQNNKYYIRKIKYQGREISVPELEQIIKSLEEQQNDKSN